MPPRFQGEPQSFECHKHIASGFTPSRLGRGALGLEQFELRTTCPTRPSATIEGIRESLKHDRSYKDPELRTEIKEAVAKMEALRVKLSAPAVGQAGTEAR